MEDPFNATSSEWLETAWSNFERACRAIKSEDYTQVVFYAHQTVETAIKAYLTSKGYKVLHTHDLKVLVEEAIKLSLKIDIKVGILKNYLCTILQPDIQMPEDD